MSGMTRRGMLRTGFGAAGWAWLGGRAAGESAPAAIPAAAALDLPVIGQMKARPAKAIAASPLGVGFETLDRRHFDPERTYPHMAALGAKWARCQTGWGRTERAKGEYDFAWLDGVVDSLLGIGVQPWFNLGYGNRLYTPDAPDEAAVGWAPVFSDEAREAWLRYVRKIAERFAGRVTHWEIWNEPNITNFWKPAKPSAADYVALVKATAPEIRRRVAKAVIIGGSLAGIPTAYLEGCLEAGLADLVDRISYHPYRAAPEANYEKEVRALRDLIGRYKKDIPIWQGENGCPSVRGGAGALADLDWNEERQAKWLLRRILGDLRLEVELTSYFLIVDLVGYRGSTNFKGLLRGKDYTPKPSYGAYQRVCALFDAETRRADLAMAVSGAEAKAPPVLTAAFRRRGRALGIYWAAADLLKGWTPAKVTVRLATAADAQLEKPVLADPLTGRIHRLDAARKDGDAWMLEGLPLADYPLLVADAAVVGV